MSAFEKIEEKTQITYQELFNFFLKAIKVDPDSIKRIKQIHNGFKYKNFNYITTKKMVIEKRAVCAHVDGEAYSSDTKIIQHSLSVIGDKVFCHSSDTNESVLINFSKDSFYELVAKKHERPKLVATDFNRENKDSEKEALLAYRDVVVNTKRPSLFDDFV